MSKKLNHYPQLLRHALAAMVVLSGLSVEAGDPAGQAASADNTAAPATTNTPVAQVKIPKSVFILPSVTNEGRDPFFPDAVPQYSQAVTNTSASPEVPKPVELVLQGISGAAGSRLAIINNHSFGVGEESEILTGTTRTRVRCLDISTNTVLVEVGSERRELRLARPR